MPIYEYQCRKCGSFEVTQRITDEPLKKCPSCRSKVSKLISQTSFQLKGSGWYVTDYAGKGKGESDKADTASSTESTDSPASSKASDSAGKTSKKKDGAKKTEASAA